jgi:hypothetical protein
MEKIIAKRSMIRSEHLLKSHDPAAVPEATVLTPAYKIDPRYGAVRRDSRAILNGGVQSFLPPGGPPSLWAGNTPCQASRGNDL